jgi:hypothetical protein
MDLWMPLGAGGGSSSTGNHSTGCAEHGGLFSFRSHGGALRTSLPPPPLFSGVLMGASPLLPTGAAVSMTCFSNGTGIYEVGPGGSCELVDAVTGKGTPLGVYYGAGGLVLHLGVQKLQARRNARQAQEQAKPLLSDASPSGQAQPSLTAVQKAALFGEVQPNSSGGSGGGWREKLESQQLMWLWLGVAILCDNIGQTQLENLQTNTLSLQESNAIDDADSVITVVQDVFSFFEDGMTVLIGAAVGAGDTVSAGTLTTLGFIGGALSGVVGAGVGTVAALTPAVMHAVVPAPGGGDCGGGGGGGGGGTISSSQAELERLALPYWLIAVWSWGFNFCNSVGTGVVLGTNATFGYALATVAKRLAAMACFVLLAEALGHTAAVALADLLGSVAYFAVVTHTIFVYERVRTLVPRPSWAEFWSPQTAEWAQVAGRAGAAMMVNMLVGQAQSTASTQLLARMGKGGLQYRAKIFSTITKNFWMPTMLGYVVRLTGSKFWGARMYPAFRYIARLCLNGTLLLCGMRERYFLRHFYINAIILPRQARDKHRKSFQKRVPFSCRCGGAGGGSVPRLVAVLIRLEQDLPLARERVHGACVRGSLRGRLRAQLHPGARAPASEQRAGCPEGVSLRGAGLWLRSQHIAGRLGLLCAPRGAGVQDGLVSAAADRPRGGGRAGVRAERAAHAAAAQPNGGW